MNKKRNPDELAAGKKKNALELKNSPASDSSQKKEIKKEGTELILTKKELALQKEIIILDKKLALAIEQEKLAKKKYNELYNFAPSGYLTLSREGKIIDSNLLASKILGKESSLLKDLWFGIFVTDDTKPIFNNFLEQVFKSKTRQLHDVTLSTEGSFPKYVYLIGIVTGNTGQCLITINDITDRKQAEEALRESEERFELLFKNAPLGYQSLDSEGNFIDVNQKWLDTLGYSRDEVIGRWFGDFLSPDYRDSFRDRFQIYKAEGKLHTEFKMLHKNGNKLFIAFEGNIGNNINGEFKQTHSILQDITEFKQTQRKLMFISKAVESTSDAICIFDANGNHYYQNKAFADLFGYSTAEEMNTAGGIANLTKEPEVAKEKLQNIRSGKSWSGESDMVTKSGEIFPAFESADAIKDNSGKIIGLIGVITNITERKKAEQALKESESKFKTVADFTFDWEFWLSDTNIFIYNSPSCEKITGYKPGDFSDNINLVNQIIHPEDLALYKTHRALITKTMTSQELDYRIITRSGDVRWLNQVCQPVFDEANNYIGIRGSNRDITRRKKAEDFIQELNKKLKKINDDKDRFLSILGHDLRNQFTGLVGLSGLLIENIRQYDVAEVENFANQINKSAHNAYSLLEDILIWARTQSDKISYEPQKLNFAEVCRNVLEILKSNADAKNIVINCNSGEDINVFADIDMLKTIMRNLISNAIKFTHKSGTININIEDNSGNVTISVSDNGIGISPDNIKKLFDITKIHSTKGTAEESGTGLGLLLCKEFVEKHGGKIRVESQYGKGSVFYFTIPGKSESMLKSVVTDSEDGNRIDNLRILIADDNDSIRVILGEMVRQYSSEILFAKTGDEAVALFGNNPDIDLILMDFYMPGLDGYEATMKIRQINKKVIIIVETADSLSNVTEEFAGVTINDYFPKPFNKSYLKQLIIKHFSKRNK